MKKINLLIAPVAAAAFFCSANEAQAAGDAIIELNVNGQTWGFLGTAANTDGTVFIGNAVITGIGWNVNITALGGSWRSESRIALLDPDGTTGVFVGPGTHTSPGGPTNYQSGGILKLANYNIPNVEADANGFVYWELFETYDDGGPGVQDSNHSGTYYLQIEYIPAPGAIALLGAAGLVTRRRRRA